MRTALIMAGGTGGHIYPGIAMAKELASRGWHIEWLGTPQGMENRIVPEAGFPLHTVAMTGVRGKGVMRWLAMPFMLIGACIKARRLLKQLTPHLVIGIGGYMSVPGGLMAWITRRPLVILEPGARAGIANRLLALFARRVLVGFSDAFAKHIAHPVSRLLPVPKHVDWTGTPLRGDVTQVPPPEARYKGRSGRLRVLIVGGSLGAQTLNDLVMAALRLIPEHERPHVTHQSGDKNYLDLKNQYADAKITAEVLAFINNIAEHYALCDVLICRAGAITVAEVAAAGVAAIFVPLPWVVGDEQSANAQALVDQNAAWVLSQNDAAAPQRLAQMLRELTRERLVMVASNARKFGRSDATRRAADICEEVARAA